MRRHGCLSSVIAAVRLVLVPLTLLSSSLDAADLPAFKVLHEWHRLDFDWPQPETRKAALESEEFVPDYCALSDVKAVDGEVFVTVPRWKHGVPSTVNQVVQVGNQTLLRPYPSWEMNTPGDCQHIQYAHVIEIDPQRRMWIVDHGRWGIFSRPTNECPPKLVIWDMVAGKQVRRHVFPDQVVERHRAILRGIVLDTASTDPDDWFAYIASTGADQLVVYSYREDASWFIQHDTMKLERSAIGVDMSGGHVATFPAAIDSLAMTPRTSSNQRLFFAAASSFQFYSIPTSLLRSRNESESVTVEELDRIIRPVGARSSQSEGMTVSDSGIMYYSVLNNNAINQWNVSKPFSAVDQVYKDDRRLQWVDSFGWDGGYLYFTSNKMHQVGNLEFDTSDQVMFRLMRAKVGMNSYMGAYPAGSKVGVAGGAASKRRLPAETAFVSFLVCVVYAAAAMARAF